MSDFFEFEGAKSNPDHGENSHSDQGFINDITPILSETQIIRTIMDNSQDTLYFKDSLSRFIMNSRAHALQFGLSDPVELLGKSDADFYPQRFADKAITDEQEIMRSGRPIIGKIEKWERDDGTVVWFSASKYPLYNDIGQIVGTWGTSRDITELKEAQQELENVNARLEKANATLTELAVIDELSGLYNRRNFDDILQKTFKLYTRLRDRSLPASFCLLIIDIDNFKVINDTYGHLEGDAAIRFTANLLTSHIRTSDYSFRYGGDEYAIILPDTPYSGGIEVAQKLRGAVENTPLMLGAKQLNMTISIGLACFKDQTSGMQLLHTADENLYKAKQAGKNCVN